MSSGAHSGISNGTIGSQGSLEQMNAESTAIQNETILSNSMPNNTKAVTPREKFTKYSLDYDNPNARGKAEAYERGLKHLLPKKAFRLDLLEFLSAFTAPVLLAKWRFGTKKKIQLML